ncbi:class I SAM-dependent methyltransferase [candidate division KSB1 bacterium]|nr:class I SAM-dependent methyltransferase [candidate division KSB1 bacterium]
MGNFWDERYADEKYVYGTEPNAFFRQLIHEYRIQGNILLPGEGEGRNAVFAARSALKVTAFDQSIEGQKKALKLAAAHQLEIEYQVGDLNKLKFNRQSFDAIALMFVHFLPPLRNVYHQKLSGLLKKNGLMIIEGFSKKQIEYRPPDSASGGPKNVDMLYSVEEIKNDFPDLEVLKLQEEIIELNEGIYHNGKSAVIRFVGRKK